MSTPNIFKNKLRNILLSNYINTTNKNTLNNDSTISKALINTHRRIHKDNNILQINGISPFRNLTSKNFDTIKPKKNYDKNKLTKNRNKMKILNEINKLNKKKRGIKNY